jgi:hypothetical protein
MRDIRSRIAQRSGIELSNQQIQELAARRLEAILDPRGLKPELLDQLRRSAGERTVSVEAATPGTTQSYPFDEASLYDSPNGFIRLLRKLFRPFLRMLFNPTPIAHALALQSRLNTELATRETERDRRQAEWNALHYEILHRLVTEVARGSIEAQSLSMRVESLGAKVDFNERRVRSMEGTHTRPARPAESAPPAQQQAVSAQPADAAAPQQPAQEGSTGDAPRRRRRRRRGRRGPGTGVPADAAAGAAAQTGIEEAESETDTDEGFEEEAGGPPEPVPLDHRLPAPAAHHDEAALPPTPEPVRDDSSHTPEE